jgi:hypothetical protein
MVAHLFVPGVNPRTQPIGSEAGAGAGRILSEVGIHTDPDAPRASFATRNVARGCVPFRFWDFSDPSTPRAVLP